jgi:hypothetical protein
MIGGIRMGLFDKLNDQLDINEHKSRLFEEDELKRAERMLFEGYSLNILEKGNSSWHSYYTYDRKDAKDFNKRISNPWKPLQDKEKEDLKDQVDKLTKERDEARENNSKKEQEISEDQERYNQDFEYLFKKHITTYKEYVEQINIIERSSLFTPDEKKTKKHEIKDKFSKTMEKIKADLKELNDDYRNVRHKKLLKDVLYLDDDADTERRPA